jgi:membrane associated rhomboid family serine protease
MIPLHDDNPTEVQPVVTIAILVSVALVFLYQASLGPEYGQRLIFKLGVIPAVLLGEARLPPELGATLPVFSIVTSMFLHGGFMHLAGNMLYLWIFGNNVEDAMGHARFIVFYVLCGIVAALGQVLQAPHSEIPMIGASGAISGVLGAYMLLYPHARVLVLVPLGFVWQTFSMPAIGVLGLWFLIQVLSSLAAGGDRPGVAFMAHVAGFVAGMALIPVFKYRRMRLWHAARPRSDSRDRWRGR